LGPPPLGTPKYDATPLLSAGHRLLEDEAVGRHCRHYVIDHGGDEFFSGPKRSRELHAVHDEVAAGARWSEQSQEGFMALVESEFRLSKECFERHLGYSPTYFAYPWMLGADPSLTLAARFGIKAVFGVGMDYRRAKRVGGQLPAFGRTKCDWLRFLPGEGRTRLRDVVPAKIRNFLSSRHLAH
jgi:hypothetical protein